MADLYVTATLVTRPEQVEELREILLPAIDKFRAEDGCLSYTLLEDRKDKGRFFTYECWRDEAALEAHMKADTMRSLGPDMEKYLIEGLDQHLLSVLKSS